jgi:hypothetical protein
MTGHLSAVWSHFPAYVVRFALIIHCCRQAEGQYVDLSMIDADNLREASRIVQWFSSEARRIYSELANFDGDDLQRTIRLAQRMGGRITPRELRQYYRAFRDNGVAAKALLEQMVESRDGHWTWRNGHRRTQEFVLDEERAA